MEPSSFCQGCETGKTSIKIITDYKEGQEYICKCDSAQGINHIGQKMLEELIASYKSIQRMKAVIKDVWYQ